MNLILSFLLISVSFAQSPPSTPSKSTTGQRQVLPAHVRPSHYDLTIIPNLNDVKYTGHVTISLNIIQPTKTIVANAKELEINLARIKLKNVNGVSTLVAKSISFKNESDTVMFEFENMLPAGATGELYVEFSGVHNDKKAGFYRSPYSTAGNQTKHMVVTQFQPTDCRRAFPSWDEPNLKATFQITLVIPSGKNLTALSNMPISKQNQVQTNGQNMNSITFATTPLMSTYLLAMAVGEFDFIEGTVRPSHPANAKPVLVRAYTAKGQAQTAKFGLDTALKSLPLFSEFFDIPFPLPKMDLLALSSTATLAMENWGLATFAEASLLCDEKTATVDSKREIAHHVTYEISHQWFGNLVTMDWWSELGLYEGFADYIGWVAVNRLFPNWNVWPKFVTETFADALSRDSQLSSHPLVTTINNPAEIQLAFDGIIYHKTSSVLRMLDVFVSHNVFMNGVRYFLKAHAYKNANMQDFLLAISQASGKPMDQFMSMWIQQTGFPIVEILSETFDAQRKTMTLNLKQSRYVSDLMKNNQSVTANAWSIPISVITHTKKPVQFIFNQTQGSVSFPYSEADGSFYKLNAGMTGFYRVKYTPQQLTRLGNALKRSIDILSVEDRIGIVQDIFAISNPPTALELISNFQNEENLVVLTEMSNSINNVWVMWSHESPAVSDALESIRNGIFCNKLGKYGFNFPENEDSTIAETRKIIMFNCRSNPDVISDLLERFSKFIAGNESALPPIIRGVAYSVVLKNSRQMKKDFESILKVYNSLPAGESKTRILTALGAVSDTSLLQFLLDKVLLDTKQVPAEEMTNVLEGVQSYSPIKKQALPMLWTWLKTNWGTIYERLSSEFSLLGNVFTACIFNGVGTELIQSVEAWARGDDLSSPEKKAERQKQVKVVEKSMATSLEHVKSVTALINRDLASMERWATSFKSYKPICRKRQCSS